jgi:hypothetical protein
VEGVISSPDGTRVAFDTNEDGCSRLYLLDTASFAYAPIAGVPMGVIGAMTFDWAGARLAFAMNIHPPCTLSLCSPLSFAVLNSCTDTHLPARCLRHRRQRRGCGHCHAVDLQRNGWSALERAGTTGARSLRVV